MRPTSTVLFQGFAGHGPLYDVHARLSVNGILLDNLLGFNPLVGATWTAHVDQLATSGQIRLALGSGSSSTSPFVSASALGTAAAPLPGATFALETATVAKSQPPSGWATVWDGEIDAVDVSGSETVLACRDRMCIALDTIIEPAPDTDIWGFWRSQESMHSRLQGIQSVVQDYAFRMENLILFPGGDPDWTVIASWTDAGISVAEAWHRVVLQRGWAIHYRYLLNGGTEGAVVYYDPVLGVGTGQYEVGAGEIIGFQRFAQDRVNVRNAMRLYYGASRAFLDAGDGISIGRYGRRWMGFGEEFTQEIDTEPEADRMIHGGLDSLANPEFQIDYERFYFWPVEMGDQHLLPASLPPQKDGGAALSLCVLGYTHTLDFRPGGQQRSVIRTLGTRAVAQRRWIKTRQQMVHVSLDEPTGGAPSGAVWYQVESLDPPA